MQGLGAGAGWCSAGAAGVPDVVSLGGGGGLRSLGSAGAGLDAAGVSEPLELYLVQQAVEVAVRSPMMLSDLDFR